jgi:hypothetical protein
VGRVGTGKPHRRDRVSRARFSQLRRGFGVPGGARAASLDTFPERGRRVGEFDDPAVRELIVGSYRLIYRVRTTKVVILAFVHTARDLASLLSAEPQ